MSVKVESFDFTPRFKREYKGAQPDIRKAADEALQALMSNPGAVRLHDLKGHKPRIYALDVFTNHSWQITLEMSGTKAVLRRLARHSEIDRSP
jgi:hypothetical protein